LADRSRLMQVYRELARSRKDAAQFIGQVFRSRDEVWVERCVAIINEGTRVG
jgi:hypothetical protein